ncbi:hypothetical protein BOS5A_200115 [Bosea sp. EC-HK365B]|nr:hypothetical protein BOSE21B_100115 [Bosea sp. 21B]CAD5286239.1 hypothetical protein BOSE7B_41414 [Bosea sp. 7B]VVT57476.1 hypothetical protein BOS5A_200115 [Bosea sp. EC-HK365B]VXC94147.1 hypothetical protein BOSE127_80198 [Bosea sp. 127]
MRQLNSLVFHTISQISSYLSF